MNEEQAREIAIQILGEFEELLAAKGIEGRSTIPAHTSRSSYQFIFAPPAPPLSLAVRLEKSEPPVFQRSPLEQSHGRNGQRLSAKVIRDAIRRAC